MSEELYRKAEPVEVFEVTAPGTRSTIKVEARWNSGPSLKGIYLFGMGMVDRPYIEGLIALLRDLLEEEEARGQRAMDEAKAVSA